MRVIVCVDMEGIGGIFVWEQVTGGNAQYEEGRRLLTEEINAAVRGARKACATEVVVYDLHGAGGGYSFKSVLLEHADPGAHYVLGGPWMRYTKPLADGCDAVLLVGAHAMAGTKDGVLCHTMSSQSWYNAWINDTLVGESGLCAGICGHWNAPVAFVSGDQATCDEVQTLLGPQVTPVVTKWGIGRFAARCLAPLVTRALIEEKVAEALNPAHLKQLKIYNPQPATLKVQLATPDQANQYRGKIGLEIVDERTVISRGDDFWEAWDHFWPH
ncbi:MAG: M55 family metallopeptidase [Chloroflexi bacterium]|nr:M55 family metallopeptidase [Chloroflexota bacterium]